LTCTLPTKILPQSHTPTQNTNRKTTHTHTPTTHDTHSHHTLHPQTTNTHTYTPRHKRAQNTPANTQRIHRLEIASTPVSNPQASAPMEMQCRCSAALHHRLENSVLHDRWTSRSTDCATLHRTEDSYAQPRARTWLHIIDPWIEERWWRNVMPTRPNIEVCDVMPTAQSHLAWWTASSVMVSWR
jgi:hypothetical protein